MHNISNTSIISRAYVGTPAPTLPLLNPILSRRDTFNIIVDGVDVTPIPLFVKNELLKQDSQDVTEDTVPSFFPNSSFSSSLPLSKAKPVDLGSIQLPFTDAELKEFAFDLSEDLGSQPEEQFILSKSQPSKLIPFKEPEITDTSTEQISIVLKETPTIVLFSRPSMIAEIGTEEGLLIEKDNSHHEYMKNGEGCKRYTHTAEVQTDFMIMKTKNTRAQLIATNESSVLASTWDLHNSFQRLRNS